MTDLLFSITLATIFLMIVLSIGRWLISMESQAKEAEVHVDRILKERDNVLEQVDNMFKDGIFESTTIRDRQSVLFFLKEYCKHKNLTENGKIIHSPRDGRKK